MPDTTETNGTTETTGFTETTGTTETNSTTGMAGDAEQPGRVVLLASPRSFCAGVERAIEVVERALERHGSPVFVRKQIVHNRHVVAELAAKGAVFVDDVREVPRGATVIYSAHGVAPAVRTSAAERSLTEIDATCPLVTKVHSEARRFLARGDTVLLIGHAGHEEVEGTLGEAPGQIRLIESVEDARAVEVPDPRRLAYLTQTTLSVDETDEIVRALRERFPAIGGPAGDDICYATTNRQDAVRAIADQADVMLVVGSENSSNTRRLVELSERQGTKAYLIDDTTEIRDEWLVNAHVIGLTAGASAPQHLIDEVVAALRPTVVREHSVATETVTFTLPAPLRPTHEVR